jgi:hypothetical protein
METEKNQNLSEFYDFNFLIENGKNNLLNVIPNQTNIENLQNQDKKEHKLINNDKNILKKQDIKTDIKNNIDIFDSDDNIIQIHKELQKELDEYLENTNKAIKNAIKLKNILKKINKTHSKLIKKPIKEKKINDWGFIEQRNIPKSIEQFFNLESGSRLSRTEIGSLFQNYIEQNNLKGNINTKKKLDKRIYKIDDKLSTLFKISQENKNKINSSTSSKTKYPDGFNFYNYQTWIKKLFVED